MIQYRNKLVYDASTGEIRDERKHMSMLEDFWLPRREGGKGTEITTLPAGQNLGEMEDVKYFQKNLLNALNIPASRLDTNSGSMMGLGRTTEVTRDEVKFSKFVNRLRNKFAQIFDHALKIQLVLKGVCTTEEWDDFREQIYYDFIKDNNFTEMRDAELLRERVNTATMLDPFIGKYYSAAWVRKNVLQMTDEEIEQMEKEIEEEGPVVQPGDEQAQQQGQVPPEDNSAERTSFESATPELDAEVEKSALNINKK
jgi:hypothetical protein